MLIKYTAIPILTIFALFWSSHLYEGHWWGDDFAQYILHSLNFINGKSYSDIGYIYNKNSAEVGPPAYPPIFPLLLASILYFKGISLVHLKLTVTTISTLFLGVVFLNFKELINRKQRLLFIVFMSFNSFFFEINNSILSDMPFALFAYTFLYILHTFGKNINLNKPCSIRERLNSFFISIALILTYLLSYGTRTIGIVLIPVYIVSVIYSDRKLSLHKFIIFFLFILSTILIREYTQSEVGGYSDQFGLSYLRVLSNVELYLHYLSTIFNILNSSILEKLVFYLTLFLAVIGFVEALLGRFKKHGSPYEPFFVFYIGVIFLWPSNQGLRFLIPLIPLYLLYTFEGYNSIYNRYIRGYKLSVLIERYLFRPVIISYVCIMVCTTITMEHPMKTKLASGIEEQDTKELFTFIKTSTDKNSKFLFGKPRALSLFGERAAGTPSYNAPLEATLEFIRDKNIRYTILSKKDQEPLDESNSIIKSILSEVNGERSILLKENIFENKTYIIYKIQ